MTSTATAKAQRWWRRQGALRRRRLFCPSIRLFCLMVWYSCGTVMQRHSCARGNYSYTGSRRGGISDFGAAAESNKGRWVRPASIATADIATVGPNIGRDPVRSFSPDLGLEVKEGCGPCVLRPPAPWDARRPSVRRRRPWADHARCFCSSSKNCGVDATRTAGHRTEPHPGWGLQFNTPPLIVSLKQRCFKKKRRSHLFLPRLSCSCCLAVSAC